MPRKNDGLYELFLITLFYPVISLKQPINQLSLKPIIQAEVALFQVLKRLLNGWLIRLNRFTINSLVKIFLPDEIIFASNITHTTLIHDKNSDC